MFHSTPSGSSRILIPLATLALAALQLPAQSPTLATAANLDANPLRLADGALTLDVHFNSRFEARDNCNDFDSSVNSPTDASWLLTRFRLGALFRPADLLTFYVQGQDIRELGGSRPNNVGTFGADGDDVFDLLQAWVELGRETQGPSLRAGRQPLNYGDQRLLGNPQWLNSSRVWDAIRLRWAAATWNLDLFTGSPVTFINNQWNQSDYFDTHESRNALVSGAWFSSATLIPRLRQTDFYLIHQQLEKQPGTPGAPLGAAGRNSVWSLGTLLKSERFGPWDSELEAVLQFGRAGGLPHLAYASHAGLGYNFEGPWAPRLGVQYNYASGDSDTGDRRSRTFQNLFPGNHALYGFMDTTAWMNLHNPQINFSIQPTKRLKITFDAMTFWNATQGDVWYGANTSTTVRPANKTASRYRGTEFDINAWYKLNSHVTFQTGYACFLAGHHLSDTGASDNAHFGYAQLSLTF